MVVIIRLISYGCVVFMFCYMLCSSIRNMVGKVMLKL